MMVAASIGMTGLESLRIDGESRAESTSDILASALAARLAFVPEADREETLQRAARRSGAELILVSSHLQILVDASLGKTMISDLRRAVATRDGETATGLGRVRYSARPLSADPRSDVLLAFVRMPGTHDGGYALVRALVALTTILTALACMVAYALARDTNKDVDFVASRIRGMLHVRTEPTGEVVPVRTMDEVGMLTVAFNVLIERFAVAQRDYQIDLDRVSAADRERAAFLAAVSHELRSPLNAILGFANVLATEVDGPLSVDAREDVEQILGSGAHLRDLINDILELSALESGQLKLNRARVDLAAIAAEVVRESAVLVGEKAVTVRVDADAGVIAHGDAKRIRQIVTNLVGNAIKFTQRGEVVVRVASAQPYGQIRVSDTGPGIGRDERSLIFDEYKQTKEERGRRRGTGLGLAITRRLVAMHGGQIRLESEIGYGSTFEVLLPLASETSRGGS